MLWLRAARFGPNGILLFQLLRDQGVQRLFEHRGDVAIGNLSAQDVWKEPGELTSRRLPSRATCEEFSEVMTRYGLWHLARLDQVRDNFASGVVQREDTAAFDTTHVIGNSHCANVIPIDVKVCCYGHPSAANSAISCVSPKSAAMRPNPGPSPAQMPIIPRSAIPPNTGLAIL